MCRPTQAAPYQEAKKKRDDYGLRGRQTHAHQLKPFPHTSGDFGGP